MTTTETHLMTLLTEALALLDAAKRHRADALSPDPVARMIAAEQWQHYIIAVEKLRRKVAAVAQKGA